jgi:hypothetical protein
MSIAKAHFAKSSTRITWWIFDKVVDTSDPITYQNVPLEEIQQELTQDGFTRISISPSTMTEVWESELPAIKRCMVVVHFGE